MGLCRSPGAIRSTSTPQHTLFGARQWLWMVPPTRSIGLSEQANRASCLGAPASISNLHPPDLTYTPWLQQHSMPISSSFSLLHIVSAVCVVRHVSDFSSLLT